MKLCRAGMVLFIIPAFAAVLFFAGCGGEGSGTGTGVATITVDGDISDWAGRKPIVRDPEGDNTRDVSGSDIVAVYIERDDQNLYARIDLANGTPSSELYFGITPPHGASKIGDRFIFIIIGQMICAIDEMTQAGPTFSHDTIANGQLAVNGQVIELSVPFAELNMSGTTELRVSNNTSGPSIDESPVATISF